MSFVSKVSVIYTNVYSLVNQTLYPSVLVNKVEPYFFACNLTRTLESVCSIAAAYEYNMSGAPANSKMKKQRETEEYLSKIRLKEVFQLLG